ncbi:FAD-dependent hydroxylase [Synechococcus sp. PCC 6312]|uniref:FAD-dependent hydroxylase n=1 Tax=Synechococcus sp. (strain ATCC 27167 / PCC 6312) TaxID=195253 RepID=UPI00029F372D|nr:FAD-dependent hydroxylase [Synechococcus sp. PCC 6312]AFY59381.1 Ubiquinone biosynthesis hydroxylase, UbiH/UbiF/VisC/COQ6 family [Synechococcus sp. PCC 6312]
MVATALRSSPETLSPGQFYDLVIVGGGIVGLTLASFFRNQALTVAVVERQTQSQAAAKQQAYALHLCSQKILAGLGIWSDLEPRVQPFTEVKLSDGNYPYIVQYQARDIGTDTVGYVAQHGALLSLLQGAINHADNIHYLCPYVVQGMTPQANTTRLSLSNSTGESLTLEARLVIAADGSQSSLRQQVGITQQGWPYPQNCVVATLEFSQTQAPIAYERFWPTGPLGVLPLSSTQYRIVWTLPAPQADIAVNMTDGEFCQALQPHLDPAMGEFHILGPRFQFPTRLCQSQAYVQSRFALVGDAAHTCHPVGGQGLNLGIRDAAALAQVILQAWERGEDIGTPSVLKRYQRWRLWQNWLILGFTDILNRLFSNQAWGIVQLRRLILQGLGRVALLRYLSLRFMAGLWGN